MSIAFDALAGMNPSAMASDREKLAATARQFEALFLRQMLSAARKSDFGGDALFGGEAMDTFRQLRDEHFADLAAQKGTIGMAKLIEAQMARLLPDGASAADAADAAGAGSEA